MHPGSIAEQKYDQCLKHNFTDCKFEASLRVYTGNSEECERKLQGSPERQQEMKIIKKKLAQTCEISSEEIKKPDCASPQKRKEAKNIQRLDHNCKQRTPPLVISPDPHEYDAKSIDVFCFKSTRETNKLEESNADFIQEDSRNDYGKRDKKVQDAISNVHTRDIILTDHVIGKWHISHRRLSVVAPVQNNNVTLYLKHLMKNKTVSQIHR
ncbi:uncharacterized protein LOC119567223 isoform X2 [Chelonia mydas]|uniref:uncharacterized protein LOC119567223 isoform X2 n=1 Tax=Chelonia mydas TaxID=8469 RepID=UPI0018A1C79F|nr:uncharacterized protein LOC119567223 isoform X2 [Chelonia mydas]